MYDEILEKLQELHGPDRELDLLIGITVGNWELQHHDQIGDIVYVPEANTSFSQDPGGLYPALTESLGDVIAFIEEVDEDIDIFGLLTDAMDAMAFRGFFPKKPFEDQLARSLLEEFIFNIKGNHTQ